MREHAPLVLIVDDDDDTRHVYSRLLSHRGYAVAQAPDAHVGLQLARALRPALVIIDYVLPGLSGWDATRILKADPATARIPVINVTAYTYEGIASDAGAAGCDAFMEKPCDPFDVIQAVTGLIGAADDRVPAPRISLPGIPGDAAVA